MKKRLLMIDDETCIQTIVKLCLEKMTGWQVTPCNAQQGLQAAREGHWDAIILEVALLGMDGLTLLNQLQTDSQARSIPVVLLTSRVLPNDYARYHRLPIAGVIAKPFDPKGLGTDISALLGWQSADIPASSPLQPSEKPVVTRRFNRDGGTVRIMPYWEQSSPSLT